MGRSASRNFGADVEDAGRWTPVSFYSGLTYDTCDAVLEAALETVIWLEAMKPEQSFK